MNAKLMNIGLSIDRALAVVAPGWARNRMLARAHLGLIEKSLGVRGFQSGGVDRTSGKARYSKRGPQEAVKADLATSRTQARDLYRYNPYARGVINSIIANLIGCGIRPQARVIQPRNLIPDETFNDAAEEAWREWIDGCDPSGKENFYGQQAMIERELYVAGEVLLIKSAAGDDRDIPLATEVVPSERLSDKTEAAKSGGSEIIQGVQFAASGAIEGYWIWPNHPGDSNYATEKPKFYAADQVIHFFDPLEPGQHRGLTRFLTVAGALEGYMQWLEWLLIKERVTSAFAIAILQGVSSLNTPISTGDASDATDENGNEIDYLEGGTIAHLRPGEDIKGIQSGVQAAAVDLLSQIFLRVVARGLDVAYEIVSRDLTKVTYLSARQGENQDRRHWEPQQEEQNRTVNRPLWKDFIRAAFVAGKLPTRQLQKRHYAVEFVRPGWDWIDPSKDIDATKEAIMGGLRSPIEEIIKHGGDPYKVLRDLKQFKTWSDGLGLKLDIFTVPSGEVSNAKKDKDDGQKKAESNSEAQGAARGGHPTNGATEEGGRRSGVPEGRRLLLK